MTNSFTFDGYTVRRITERDRPYIQIWIDADPHHRGKITANFFLKLHPGEDSWALEDEQGMVVFYFKTGTAVRVFIQFAPEADVTQKLENRNALMKGLHWIEGLFRANKFREIIFDTQAVDLANFAKRRLSFLDAPGLLSKVLGDQNDEPTQPSELASLATTPSGEETDANVRH